ncbi:MAG: transcription antitermination factor NusB [Planctomycetaceae bacterium]
MRKRTRARELALQLLYMADVQGAEALAQMDAFLQRHGENDLEVTAFARALVEGVMEQRGEIDAILTAATQNWELHRMALVDRNILRLAAHELLRAGDVPAKVAINEAIELGKRFSTQQSGSFINGILDRIRRERDL